MTYGRFLLRLREVVLRTLNGVSHESDFNDSIGQVARADMLQSCHKEFALLHRDDVGHDNDHASVKRFFAVQIEKVGAIVGDERVFLLADDSHQLPVFQAAESAVTYMVRGVARRTGDTYKRCMKAFVYQKLHVGVAIFLR